MTSLLTELAQRALPDHAPDRMLPTAMCEDQELLLRLHDPLRGVVVDLEENMDPVDAHDYSLSMRMK